MKFTDQQVEEILIKLTFPDTNVVAEAEGKVKLLMKTPVCVTAFLNQIQGSAHLVARQMAAILLRKKIAQFWKKLQARNQDQVKQLLLQRIISEPEKPVQMAIAGVAAAVAKITVPKGQWNELLDFLFQCSQQADPKFRELAMRVFRVLNDSIGSKLIRHFDSLFGIFVKGLEDPQSLVVREESIRALASLYSNMESEEQAEQFKKVVPLICHVIEASIKAGNDTAGAYGFELLDDFAECPIPILDEHIPAVIPFAANVVLKDSISMSIRERACSLITWIIKYQPKKLIQHNLVRNVLDSCFHLLALQQEEEDEADDQSTPHGLALELLDDLLINMPNEVVYEPAVSAAIQLIKSGDADHRNAGHLVIFVMAEGCSEAMRASVLNLIEVACIGMSDADKKVRASACSALSQLSEHLQPEIFDHHSIIIPNIFGRLDDPAESLEVKQRLICTLDSFCTELPQETISHYLEEIMKRLATLISVHDQKLQQAVIQAIGTVAASAKLAFMPFFPHIISLIKQAMSFIAEDQLPLRSMATRAAGHIATAVGKENFVHHLNDILALSLEGFKLDAVEVRESTYFLYSYISEVFGADFVGFLPNIMDKVFMTLESNDGLSQKYVDADHNDAFGAAGGAFESEDEYDEKAEQAQEADDEDADDEEDEEGGNVQYSIMTGFIDEKMAAIQAVSAFLKHSGPGFLPYFAKVLSILEELAIYLHESIRILAILTYEDVFKFANSVFPSEPWQQGQLKPLHPQMMDLVTQVLPVLVIGIGAEFEKQVASVAADVLTRIVKLVGPVAVNENNGPIVQTLFMILEENCPSQKFAVEDATAGDEDLDELFESCGDLISAMAKVYGPSFSDIFQEILPSLLAAATGDRHPGVLASVIGTLGEVTAELDNQVVRFANDIFPLVFRGLEHPSAIVRRSAAYCTGSIFASGASQLSMFYQHSLSRLEPLLHTPADAEYSILASKDNAVSALAKMLHADAAGLPVSQLARVVVQNLPLLADPLENKFVYPSLIYLMANQYSAMAELVPNMMSVFSIALGKEDVDDETKAEIASFTKSIYQLHPAELGAIIEKLPADQASTLIRHVQ
jgi:hypothetical protein